MFSIKFKRIAFIYKNNDSYLYIILKINKKYTFCFNKLSQCYPKLKKFGSIKEIQPRIFKLQY